MPPQVRSSAKGRCPHTVTVVAACRAARSRCVGPAMHRPRRMAQRRTQLPHSQPHPRVQRTLCMPAGPYLPRAPLLAWCTLCAGSAAALSSKGSQNLCVCIMYRSDPHGLTACQERIQPSRLLAHTSTSDQEDAPAPRTMWELRGGWQCPAHSTAPRKQQSRAASSNLETPETAPAQHMQHVAHDTDVAIWPNKQRQQPCLPQHPSNSPHLSALDGGPVVH